MVSHLKLRLTVLKGFSVNTVVMKIPELVGVLYFLGFLVAECLELNRPKTGSNRAPVQISNY